MWLRCFSANYRLNALMLGKACSEGAWGKNEKSGPRAGLGKGGFESGKVLSTVRKV